MLGWHGEIQVGTHRFGPDQEPTTDALGKDVPIVNKSTHGAGGDTAQTPGGFLQAPQPWLGRLRWERHCSTSRMERPGAGANSSRCCRTGWRPEEIAYQPWRVSLMVSARRTVLWSWLTIGLNPLHTESGLNDQDACSACIIIGHISTQGNILCSIYIIAAIESPPPAQRERRPQAPVPV